MAIGSDYNGNSSNDSKQSKDTTYYSRFKIRSKDQKRSFGLTFWSGFMVFEINDVDTSNGYHVNALETIRLSSNKARILAGELRQLKEYMKQPKVDPNKAFGVSSGLGDPVPYIGFSVDNNPERTVSIIIGKINGSGSIVSSQTFVVDNDEYLYALEWNNISKMDVERVQYDHLELDVIIDTLDDFAKHMSGALAYSIFDLGKYDNIKLNKRFDAIYDKLGIGKFVPQSSGSRSSNNFLNNLASNNRTSNSGSLDDLMDGLDD